MPRNYDPLDKNENENKSTHKNVWECEDGKKKKKKKKIKKWKNA